ncbi:unnamed protein product [Caenorhabditis angaria]|uniref:Little elongation complex subunit 2 C-terminal domain-containing protein n=1 Tax=Caenorhabditis angaria TaxID=860376 RepID=B6VC13_9PELO|nr:hypothetical protein Csp3_JD07.006 [Caenorhabditis angaria]CAI5446338.1 unnamed protein product [Caenorhabditis angaria]
MIYSKSDDEDESEYRCEIIHRLKEEKKYDEVVDHVLSGCVNCITDTSKFKGQEMLFPNAPPPWIEIEEQEKEDPKTWKKYQKKAEPSRAAMTAEQIDEYLENLEGGDEKIVWEIVKFKRVDRIEAWRILRGFRVKKADQSKKEKEQEMKAEKSRRAEQRELEQLKKADEKRELLEKTETQKMHEKEKLEEMKEFNEDEEEEEEIEVKKEKSEEKQGEKKKESTVFNVRKDMPWSPNMFDILCPDLRSVLNNEDQRRLSAMCQNKMNRGEFQHAANKREFTDLFKSASAEYETLVEAAKQWANSQPAHPINFIAFPKLLSLQKYLNRFNLRKLTGKGFEIGNILFTIETNQEVEMTVTSEKNSEIPSVVEVLHEGISDTLMIPEITKRCELVPELFNIQPKEKLRIEQDPNIRAYFKSNPTISVAMDATTVCHLMKTNWESKNYGMACEIVVENIDGKTCVFFAKPKVTANISRASIQRKYIKTVIRNQFVNICEKNAKLDVQHILELEKRGEQKEEFERVHMSSSHPSTISSASASTSSSDLLDSIFADVKKMDQRSSKDIGKQRKIIETGYNYSIVKFGSAEILVRSKPAFQIAYSYDSAQKKGIQQLLENRKNVTFEPRIEYLPNGGAMELGPEEWVWNYMKKLLKKSDAHVLFRTHYKGDCVLQLDALTMESSNVSSRPQGALELLSKKTMMMEKLISKIVGLDEGIFLAYQEQQQDLRIVPSNDSKAAVPSNYLNLNKDCIKSDDCDTHFFNGFAPCIMLQWQIVQGRAPRLLMAADSEIVKKLPNDKSREKIMKKQQNQQKNKRKFNKKMQNSKKRRLDLDDPNTSSEQPQEYQPRTKKWKRKK